MDERVDGTFGVEVFTSGEFAYVSVLGEVDFASASALRDRLHEILEEGAADVVVDLSGVSYIGSAGLGVLAGTMNQLRPWDGHLVVRNASRTARRLLEILGLEREVVMEGGAAMAPETLGDADPLSEIAPLWEGLTA